MDQEKKNAIALMRYSVIAPLITGLVDEFNSNTAFLIVLRLRESCIPTVL